MLEQFLPSVVEYSKEATVYVADNASSDDSIEYVKANSPTVKIIINTENGGYAKGYNDALKDLDEDVFCLLNNDIEVTENWLQSVIEQFSSTNIAIAQPLILDYKDKTKFEYAGAAGGFIDKYGFPYCKGRLFDTLETNNNQYNEVDSIFWASGACLFIKSQLYKELNGFDESFFAHMEEIDLCWRAKNSGHEIVTIPQSKVYHVGGATLSSLNPKKTYLNFRNSLLTLTKNAKGFLPFIIFPRLVLDGIAGVKFFLELKPKHTLAIIKAHFSYYAHLKSVLTKRGEIKTKVKYYKTKSVVWSYFILRKKTYNSL